MIVASFLFCLAGFVVIGVMSAMLHRHNTVDYLLASHSVPPWLVALSAVATNNSGYMFVGMIGFTYAVGLSSIWLMIGWITGDLIISFIVHKKLRVVTEEEGVRSFAGVLARWHHNQDYKYLRLVAGLITVAFLGTYAAAQLQAGSKALHVLFGWDYSAGAIIGAGIVVLYCFSGGIRASIWTDAAQSFVMICAMALMLFVSVSTVGGIGDFAAALGDVSPTYLNLFAENMTLGGFWGPVLFVGGWVFAGFGVIGQPHIMVRFMAMDQPEQMGRVRAYYYLWFSAFYAMTIGAGLAARLLLPEVDAFDPELALPTLALQLLPDVLVGLVLAGLFAATMSTADSQILSCSAAISRDFGIKKLRSYWLTKLATVLVTATALAIAVFGSGSVFILVLIAWSALGAAFGPLLIVYAFGGKPDEPLAVMMVLSGIAAVLLWRQLGLSEIMYEIAPGMLTGIAVYFCGKLLGYTESGKTPHPA